MGHESQQGSQLRDADTVRLDSWKEIAAFLHRDARTVRRWERDRRLPVHRVPGGERSGVFAYVNELEHWLHTAPPAPEAETPHTISPVSPRSSASSEVNAHLPHNDNAGTAQDSSELEASQAVPVLEQKSASTSALHWVSTFDADARSLSEPTDASGAASLSPEKRAAAPLWHPLFRTPAQQAVVVAALLAFAVGSSFFYVHYRDTRRAQIAVHRPTADAQDLYLRGRYYWNLRTEDGLNRAVDLFTQSIVEDPRYASAYAGLADSYLLLRQYGHMPNSEAFPRALGAARRAIALDDTCPEAHRSLAFILRFWNWDMPAAEREYRRAIELNPNDSHSHHWYATALLSSGRAREALAEIDTARALEPQSISVLADRGVILAMTDPRKGIAALQQVEQAQPDFLSPHTYLAGIYLDLGDLPNFFAESRKAAKLAHDAATVAVIDRAASVFAARGARAALEDLARSFAPLAEQGSVPAYNTARLFSLAGEPKQAVHFLHLSCDRRDPGFLGFERDPAFKSMHSSPEFVTLLARRDAALSHRDPIARLDLPKPLFPSAK